MTIYAQERLDKSDAARLLGNSSGMILNEEQDALIIGYVDFNVSDFGGRDYECFYKLDARNAQLLKAALEKDYGGDLFDMCAQAFTVKFSTPRFEAFCTQNGITYVKSTY